ncbi:kelch repeat-containing 1, putative [Babesia caballi]|uniref:Kelch repeat-containing 1, putative n=1 Tax=Babesia caballi TaxID=5871 RepID=A0AAV4M2F2_BABCB|nr:kelch repeat-containing 1, putative [Babesia caballi]
MPPEDKYKELKKKYITLKDAAKQVHEDFERIKAELAAKSEACAALEEQHRNLQKAYDELTDEVSHIRSLKPSKPSTSTWGNALALIKKGANPASTSDSDDAALLYSEVVSLKTQLEAASNEKEELLKQLQALRNENDNQSFEYNAAVTALKERILALEGILRDLQDSLAASEAKASRSASEIIELNSAIESRNGKLEKLEEALDSERRWQMRYVTLLENKLRTKVIYDLRRLPLVNTFNLYHHQPTHSWSAFRHSADGLHGSLISSLESLFAAWHSALRFLSGSQVLTESVLQNSPPTRPAVSRESNAPAATPLPTPTLTNTRKPYDTTNNGVTTATVVESHNTGAAPSAPDPSEPVGAQPPVTRDGSPLPPLPDGDPNLHVWAAMESYRQMAEATLADLVSAVQELAEGTQSQMAVFLRITRLVRTVSRHQRLYLCLEEYLSPYEDTSVPVRGLRRLRHGTRVFIRCLRDMCQVFSSAFTIYSCALSRLDELAASEFSELAELLSNEVGTPSTDVGRTAGNDHPIDAKNDQILQGFDSGTAVEPSSAKYGARVRALTDELKSARSIRSLSRRLFATLKDLMGVVSVFKSVVSHRLCYPKLAEGFFFPLTGGSPEMVDLGTAIADLEMHMSHITEDSVSLFLGAMLQSRRDAQCCPSPGVLQPSPSALAATAASSVARRTSQSIECYNAQLERAHSRIRLSTIDVSLRLAEEERREMRSWNERLRSMNEELMTARARCAHLEAQLSAGQTGDLQDDRLVSEVERLLSRYRFHDRQSSGGAVSYAEHSAVLGELYALREDSGRKVKKLGVYVRHLVKSVELLEDSNRQLRQALCLHAEQYAESKAAAESVHLNYNEQIALMSEHISELNNAIVQAEYRVSEFSGARITCPACRTTTPLG